MRNLAHDYGKTVLSIIHDVSEIDLFDQVIMLAKVDGVGRLAFSGTPAEARKYFGVDIRDVYALLEREPERFVK
jgi:ABC-type multidrug transport system ATPase subunit